MEKKKNNRIIWKLPSRSTLEYIIKQKVVNRYCEKVNHKIEKESSIIDYHSRDFGEKNIKKKIQKANETRNRVVSRFKQVLFFFIWFLLSNRLVHFGRSSHFKWLALIAICRLSAPFRSTKRSKKNLAVDDITTNANMDGRIDGRTRYTVAS